MLPLTRETLDVIRNRITVNNNILLFCVGWRCVDGMENWGVGWRKEPVGYVCDMEGNWMRGEEQEGCVAGGGER